LGTCYKRPLLANKALIIGAELFSGSAPADV
jgi:hypothetical protein